MVNGIQVFLEGKGHIVAGRAYRGSVVVVNAAVLFPVFGALMAGLADTFSGRGRADVASDLARGVDDIGVKKLDAP